MKKMVALLILSFAVASNCNAAVWVKLSENNREKITLDTQSILQKDNLKRVWVKIEYKTPQTSPEAVYKEYNVSKLLWFFDCAAQKSATSQVFQYFNYDLIYSAGIDAKNAEFIEPVPETDVDMAMRYVCQTDQAKVASVAEKPLVSEKAAAVTSKTEADRKAEAVAKPLADKAAAEKQPLEKVVAEKKLTEKPAKTEALPEAKKEKKSALAINKVDAKKTAEDKKMNDGQAGDKKSDTKAPWSYEGKEGPENWGKLSPEFITCEIGRNQSPINVEDTTRSAIKALKAIHKFPAKDIVHNGHTVQINFKEGNMLALDNLAFQMKQVHFHSPGENTIKGKSFPLEAHFVHADAKGNLAVVAVMFAEGDVNPGLAKLWEQLPAEEGSPVVLKSRVTPSELIPETKTYYRFSGSLTTPPCSEGVRWLLMKNPMTASKAQIEAFKRAIHHSNNRPVQPLNGRVVID